MVLLQETIEQVFLERTLIEHLINPESMPFQKRSAWSKW